MNCVGHHCKYSYRDCDNSLNSLNPMLPTYVVMNKSQSQSCPVNSPLILFIIWLNWGIWVKLSKKTNLFLLLSYLWQIEFSFDLRKMCGWKGIWNFIWSQLSRTSMINYEHFNSNACNQISWLFSCLSWLITEIPKCYHENNLLSNVTYNISILKRNRIFWVYIQFKLAVIFALDSMGLPLTFNNFFPARLGRVRCLSVPCFRDINHNCNTSGM